MISLFDEEEHWEDDEGDNWDSDIDRIIDDVTQDDDGEDWGIGDEESVDD